MVSASARSGRDYGPRTLGLPHLNDRIPTLCCITMASEKATIASSKDDVDRVHYEYLRRSLEREHERERRGRTVPLPDLRFEQGYLRSLAPYVRVDRAPLAQLRDMKGKGKAAEVEDEGSPGSGPTGEVVHIEWGPVLWITARDQIISPLLWGVVGYFYWPVISALRTRMHSWWTRGASHAGGSPKMDGHGVDWLRNWIGSLTAGSTVRGNTHKAFS